MTTGQDPMVIIVVGFYLFFYGIMLFTFSLIGCSGRAAHLVWIRHRSLLKGHFSLG